MPDAFADSTTLLERLVARVAKETDPVKYDQLAAEIWRVLEERDTLRSVLANKDLNQKESPQFGTE